MKSRKHTHYYFVQILLLIFGLLGTPSVFGDVIIDNGDAGTSFTGGWSVSGGTSPYGIDSLWARDGATYTWSFESQPAGSYEVFMWWSGWASRSDDVAVEISYHGATDSTSVDQSQNVGLWYSLGTYNFGTSGSVTMTASNGSTVSTCADAVWFNLITENSPPTAYIDSMSPNPADSGATITFTGHGEDADGTIAAHNWESSLSGILSTSSSFSSVLADGTHSIIYEVQDNMGFWSEADSGVVVVGTVPVEIIVDNLDADTSQTGLWQVSGGPDPYGANSVWSRDGGTFTWSFTPPQAGTYDVSIWWTALASRSVSAPILIDYLGGSETVYRDQQQDGGQWNYLGTYVFDGSEDGTVTIIAEDPYPVSYSADAVKFDYNSGGVNNPPTALIDSITPNPATEGTPVSFVGHGEDTDGTVTGCTWTSSIDGPISSELSFNKSDLSVGVHTISMTVEDDDAAVSGAVTDILTIQPAAGNLPPTAVIDSITPSPATEGMPVSFVGHGEDSDGTIDGCTWTSSIDGFMSNELSFGKSDLSVGVHTISMTVYDDDGDGGIVSTTLIVESSGSGSETIIDNGDIETSSTGSWAISGGLNPYGVNSYWSRDGATYTWTFTPSVTGTYEVSMWWTQWSSRSTSIPVEVEYDGGIYATSIDQQQDGGQWNVFETLPFISGVSYDVTIISQPGPTSTCADAVKFLSVVPNENPTAFIDSIAPSPASIGQEVSFLGHGEDADGTVTSCVWFSSIDGQLSTEESFAKSDLSLGEHTISMTVYDDDGAESAVVTQTLIIQEISVEMIIDNGDIGTSSTGSWAISGGLDPYGANSYWSRDGATYTWTFTPPVTGNYEVSLWWTEWSSRSTSIPVEIEYDGGTYATSIDQQQDGGQWNVINTLPFISGVSYNVTITSQANPTSTCADALRCVYQDGGGSGINIPPDATINSISPNPATEDQTVNFIGQGDDADGTIVGYNWRSSINGNLGTSSSISTSALSVGTHTVYLMVQDNDLEWSDEVSRQLVISGVSGSDEHIFACFGYAPEDSRSVLAEMLEDIGASQNGTEWTYTNGYGQTFVVHIINELDGLIEGLQTPGAHVLYYGHSNYGLGPVFADSGEFASQIIEDIRCVDDDRILNISTPFVHVNVNGMRTGQAYPYWWPEYEDGTSAIAPYDFGDPRGDPPYNYYITYQPPGYSEYFKVESVNNGAIERFSDSRKPAWFSSDGSAPDASNPDHEMYFITNPNPWEASFETVGNWTETIWYDGFYKENTLYCPSGTGSNQAAWMFDIPIAGNYNVLAWWSSGSNRPSNAPYTVNHSSGSTTFLADQRYNGGQWNEIGQVYFDVGSYPIVLTNDCNGSIVFADAVMVSHVDNPPEIMQADFSASTRSGTAPFEVNFNNRSNGDYTDRRWIFGDGAENSTRDWVDHTYSSPGTYTVTLEISGPTGDSSRTKTGYITVTSSPQDPPLQAEFSSWGSSGSVPLSIYFSDRSTGDFQEGLTYTPDPGFTGTDSFSYRMYDKEGVISNVATVDVLVYDGNVVPEANDDEDNTRAGTAVDIDVLDNDRDIGGSLDETSVAITSGASNGTTSVDASDGTVTYTPGGSFTGTDNFSYTVRDDDGVLSNVATVSVFVGNMAPVANDDSDETELNTPEDIDVLSNDRDTDGSIDETTVVITSGPSNGTTAVNAADGVVTYTPNSGYVGPDSFSYTVADDEGAVSNVAVVKINPLNVAPVANDDSAYTEINGEVNIRVLNNDDDEEGIDPATMVITNQPDNGALDIHDCWSWNFGDGETSHERSPRHTYENIGNYTVSLMVTNLNGSSDSEVKSNMVRAMVYEDSIDNVDYPKTHYRNKTLVMNNEMDVAKENFRYDRLFYLSCDSADYFAGTFDRGTMFYTTNTSGVWGGTGFAIYLQAYFQGQSDQAIWATLQQQEAVFDYFDFTQPPSASSVSLSQPDMMVAADASMVLDKVARVQMLDGASLIEVFEQLKDTTYLLDENLLLNAILVAYQGSSAEAVDLAMGNIQQPITEIVDGKIVSRQADFYISRKILEAFSDESVDCLLGMYDIGSNSVKGNVVQASGGMIGNEQIKEMIMEALGNTETYDQQHPEAQGEPLRICDLAYNQLVLYYNTSGMLRAIGSSHNLESRDYHIKELKKQL